MRVYGELLRQLDDDAVVIGDGGDFVSFAGRLIEPAFPGRWLDPGPYGCLGTGLGYAMAARLAHPASQVVLMLGDGAAGLSLMDVDTLVRHNLPVVMIVGNNSAWGLEKGPMQAVYGYDVAADLRPGTRYDEVVRAPGRRRRAGDQAGRDRRRAAARLRLVRPVPDQRDHGRAGRVPAHHHGRVAPDPRGDVPPDAARWLRHRKGARLAGRGQDQAAERVDDPGVVLGSRVEPQPLDRLGRPGGIRQSCPPGRRTRWRRG